MSYPARDLGISLYGMQHLPALSRETPKRIDPRPFIWRLVARWILSVLVATWPKGAGTDQLRQVRGTHNVIPARRLAERNLYGVNLGRDPQ
jgi:hypothetical protein